MKTEKNTFSAGLVKRVVAFLMDAIIAFLPAFVMLYVFTGTLTHKAPLLYPCPVIGTVTLATKLPVDVNKALNTENGIYLFSDSGQDTNIISTQRTEYNVSFWATACRMISILSVVFYCIYAAMCTIMYNGKTVGKKLVGIRVRCPEVEDEKKIRNKYIIREVVGKIILNSIPIIPVISIFTILFTKRHLAIHDIIAKTEVVE